MDEFLKGQARFRRPGMKMGELVWFAHQPEEIRQQWLDAMGLLDSPSPAAEVVGCRG